MIEKTFPSEKRVFRDKKTGRLITQLTSGTWNNYHLYFTDNSFTLGDRDICFLSDRSSAERGIYNYFRMDLESGVMTQLTDEPNGIGAATKTPDSEILIYLTKNRLYQLNIRSGCLNLLYEEKEAYELGAPFISPDKKYVGFVRNEKVKVETGANYKGFKESLFRIKKATVTLVSLERSEVRHVFADTHWLGHFQFSPNDSSLATFCHEGPWNLVHQRIWLLNVDSGEVSPCFRQEEDDCVGHEFWTRDGFIFFDNRRKGHDGTITSDKTQATVALTDTDQIPYIGLTDKTGEILKIIDMPYYCNHYHANNDNTLLVGDEADDLVLIDLREDFVQLHTLCNHATSWYTHQSHCHPTFSWSGDRVLYASDRDGFNHLYLIDIELGASTSDA